MQPVLANPSNRRPIGPIDILMPFTLPFANFPAASCRFVRGCVTLPPSDKRPRKNTFRARRYSYALRYLGHVAEQKSVSQTTKFDLSQCALESVLPATSRQDIS